MKCSTHNKQIVAMCEWCGKELCKLCISKTNGKKAYCSSCAAKMGEFIQKKQIEKIKEEEKETKQSAPQEYFNFNALK